MKTKQIYLSGERFPVICTLNVLADIQEQYATTREFERELLGLYFLRDESGAYVTDTKGKPQMGLKDPSAKAVKLALVSMVNEGLRVEAYHRNKECRQLSEEELLSKCNVDYKVLADFLHSIYAESFRTKKL